MTASKGHGTLYIFPGKLEGKSENAGSMCLGPQWISKTPKIEAHKHKSGVGEIHHLPAITTPKIGRNGTILH